MQPQPADYLLIGLTVLATALGLFRGLSGLFSMFVGSVAGTAAAIWSWAALEGTFPETWMRCCAAVVIFAVAFGIVRVIVKAVVGKLLAQPADSIFGVCLGLFCGAFLVWTVSGSIFLRSHSVLAQEVHRHVSGW